MAVRDAGVRRDERPSCARGIDRIKYSGGGPCGHGRRSRRRLRRYVRRRCSRVLLPKLGREAGDVRDTSFGVPWAFISSRGSRLVAECV